MAHTLGVGGGGGAAAGGLYHQALVTLGELLHLFERHDADPGLTVHIESHPATPDCPEGQQHIVDFSVTHEDQGLLNLAQVKSTGEPGKTSNRLDAPSTLSDLLRLVEVGNAETYTLITNASLTSPAEQVARALRDESLSSEETRMQLIRLTKRPEQILGACAVSGGWLRAERG